MITVATTSTKPTPNRRWWLWVPLFAFAAWLSFFSDSNNRLGTPSDVVNPVPRPIATPRAAPRDSARAPESKAPERLEHLVPRTELVGAPRLAASQSADLFAARSWTPPPPPPPQITPPPPSAPAVPFTVIGLKLEAGAWEVFLMRGEEVLTVKEGQLIDNVYRVTKIAPPTMSLTYLPLDLPQSLNIGESQ